MFCNIMNRKEQEINQKEMKSKYIIELKKEIQQLKTEYKSLIEFEERVDLYIGVNSSKRGVGNARDL